MKRKRRSVSKTFISKNGVFYERAGKKQYNGIGADEVYRLVFGAEPPEGKFRVTYTLDPEGEYQVKRGFPTTVMRYDESRIGGDEFSEDFLPHRWWERRVSRKVTLLRS